MDDLIRVSREDIIINNIKRIMNEKELKIEDVARLAGLPYKRISDMLSGFLAMYQTDYHMFAAALDVNISELEKKAPNVIEVLYRRADFAANTNRIMKEKGISSVRMTNDLYMNPFVVEKLLDGKVRPSKVQLQQIAKYLGVSTDDLIEVNEDIAFQSPSDYNRTHNSYNTNEHQNETTTPVAKNTNVTVSSNSVANNTIKPIETSATKRDETNIVNTTTPQTKPVNTSVVANKAKAHIKGKPLPEEKKVAYNLKWLMTKQSKSFNKLVANDAKIALPRFHQLINAQSVPTTLELEKLSAYFKVEPGVITGNKTLLSKATIGRNIQKLLQKNEVSIGDLSFATNIGVSRLEDITSGKRWLGNNELSAIADYFHVQNEIITGETNIHVNDVTSSAVKEHAPVDELKEVYTDIILENLKFLMEDKGVTYKDIVEVIGQSKYQIKQLITGTKELTNDDLEKLATYFKVTVSDLKTPHTDELKQALSEAYQEKENPGKAAKVLVEKPKPIVVKAKKENKPVEAVKPARLPEAYVDTLVFDSELVLKNLKKAMKKERVSRKSLASHFDYTLTQLNNLFNDPSQMTTREIEKFGEYLNVSYRDLFGADILSHQTKADASSPVGTVVTSDENTSKPTQERTLNNIKMVMRAKRVMIRDIAYHLDEDDDTVEEFLRGERPLTYYHVRIFANVLGVKIDELLETPNVEVKDSFETTTRDLPESAAFGNYGASNKPTTITGTPIVDMPKSLAIEAKRPAYESNKAPNFVADMTKEVGKKPKETTEQVPKPVAKASEPKAPAKDRVNIVPTRTVTARKSNTAQDTPKVETRKEENKIMGLQQAEVSNKIREGRLSLSMDIPVIERAKSTSDLLNDDNIKGFKPRATDYLPEGLLYYVQASDNSMAPLVPHGSFVLLSAYETPKDGDIVACTVGDDDTLQLRTYRTMPYGTVYQPLDENFPPIMNSDATPVNLLGVMVEVLITNYTYLFSK